MIVAAFYTIGTPYELEAEELRRTLDRFGLEYDIRAYEHPGSWAKAQFLTPRAIRDVRDDHPGEDVLYLDADARVTQDPTPLLNGLRAGPYDVGLYYLPNSPHSPGPDGRELCSGTTWWAATKAAGLVLDSWWCICDDRLRRPQPPTRETDQTILQTVIRVVHFNQRIAELPPEMCWIDTISEMHFGKREPIIYHTQASRRHKRAVEVRP